jgi:UDP-glucose 6-dehydrogenase
MGERIAVFGAGYAGLVTGAGFADLGHEVVVRDVVPEKVDALRAGRVPFHEPGLDEVIARVGDRLQFTIDAGEAVRGARFVFVCVGTPATYSGDADLSAVWTVLDELRDLEAGAVLVMKSTVPVGTGDKVRAALDARGLQHVGYVSNPEFLAEGSAVRDFLHPDRIVIGAFDDADGDGVERLHGGLDAPVVRTDVPSAEMVKLAANAYLGTRISFINEIANVCELVGADIQQVARGMGLDSRIGTQYLQAGIGFGGSCLVGDETVLVRMRGETRLTSLEDLFDEADEGEEIEILSWHPEGTGTEFLSIAVLTRRPWDGDVIEVRTATGQQVRSTPDHPFITNDGRKLADELTTADRLPVAQDVDWRYLATALEPARHREEHGGVAALSRTKADNAVWVRVAGLARRPYTGYVYSLEVPPTHTFVTTGGLIVSNCFPKDISFLKLLAGNSGYHFQLLNAVIEVNELQKRRVVSKLQKHLGSLRGKTIALLGLAFKPHTDDMREAPSIVLASRLLAEGADVRAWDPVADASQILRGVTFCESVLDAVRDADAAVVVTGWDELRELARKDVREAMRTSLIVDGRNVVDADEARRLGFTYEGIGRSASALGTLRKTDEPPVREPSQ